MVRDWGSGTVGGVDTRRGRGSEGGSLGASMRVKTRETEVTPSQRLERRRRTGLLRLLGRRELGGTEGDRQTAICVGRRQ